jgi:hypothetical protein
MPCSLTPTDMGVVGSRRLGTRWNEREVIDHENDPHCCQRHVETKESSVFFIHSNQTLLLERFDWTELPYELGLVTPAFDEVNQLGVNMSYVVDVGVPQIPGTFDKATVLFRKPSGIQKFQD